MAKSPVLTRAQRQAIAAKRKRRPNGQFAEGGPKGKRRITSTELSGAKDALLALRSKKAPRRIDAKSLQDAKELLGGLTSKEVKKQALEALGRELDSLAPKLTSGQRVRLLKASVDKAPKGTKGQGTVKEPKKTIAEDIVRLKADKVPKRQNIQIDGDRLEIWRGTRYEKYDPSFKQRRDRGFEYSIEVEGHKVVLNRQWNVYIYKGETVKGMPSLHPDLARMETKDLARAMVSSMSQAQASSPNAPKWDPGLHGQVEGIKWTYDLGSSRGGKKEGYYGEMQIHHIGQGARHDLKRLQADYEAGRYSPEEYKQLYNETVYKESYSKTEKGRTKQVERLALKAQDQSDRAFVALPAGLHDTNSSLFRESHHPYIYDPDGKKRQVGIPHKGKAAESGSREWFDSSFKSGFWKQVYQREAYVLRGELQRRINKGNITGKELSDILGNIYSEIES